MLITKSFTRKSAVVLLVLLTLIATNATVAVNAQQSPSTTPATGAVVPERPLTVYTAPKVVPVAPAPAQYVQYVQPVQYVQQQAQQAAPAGDAYGFIGWLNSTRASYGLPAVGYDANLEAWGQQNNAQQNARGIGHFVMGPARRQNSAMGQYASIGAMWMASPAHRAALLDPSIRSIGLAGWGAYWTFNAY